MPTITAYSVDTGRLAIRCLGSAGMRQAVLYDATALKTAVKTANDMGAVSDCILGLIQVSDCDDCPDSNVYTVASVAGRKGSGPILYDYALGLAAKDGMGGLVPDRKRNTDAAVKVWTYYHDKRSDVIKAELNEAMSSHRCRNPRGGVLNMMYSLPRPMSWARTLERNHEMAARYLVSRKIFYNMDEFETVLDEDGEALFRRMYDGARMGSIRTVVWSKP